MQWLKTQGHYSSWPSPSNPIALIAMVLWMEHTCLLNYQQQSRVKTVMISRKKISFCASSGWSDAQILGCCDWMAREHPRQETAQSVYFFPCMLQAKQASWGHGWIMNAIKSTWTLQYFNGSDIFEQGGRNIELLKIKSGRFFSFWSPERCWL